jgi:endonuclease YncB( thermonuclease family)
MLAQALLVLAGTFQIGFFEGGGFDMPPSAVMLDGERVAVSWSDGDSFEILEGRLRDGKTRLMGYNSLESYGPVHSWGDWKAEELYVLQKKGSQFVRTKVWTCKWGEKKDHYDRLLIQCDDLTEAMLAEGYGHLMAVDEEPNPAHVEIQKKAIAEKKGMWAKGVPKGIITSLHSADEGGGKKPYNRLADPMTGKTRKREHGERYRTCQKVCHDGSCLVYVPFSQRYGDDRADCLRVRY